MPCRNFLACGRNFALGRRTARAAELADADIGISWLCDDLWGQGKCGLKVLQYMAAGLPVVANSVGVHRKMIVHGESGFLVDTPEEWAEAVARLAENPSLRQRMGAAGPADVSKATTTSVAGVRRSPGYCGIWSTSSRQAAGVSKTPSQHVPSLSAGCQPGVRWRRV